MDVASTIKPTSQILNLTRLQRSALRCESVARTRVGPAAGSRHARFRTRGVAINPSIGSEKLATIFPSSPDTIFAEDAPNPVQIVKNLSNPEAAMTKREGLGFQVSGLPALSRWFLQGSKP